MKTLCKAAFLSLICAFSFGTGKTTLADETSREAIVLEPRIFSVSTFAERISFGLVSDIAFSRNDLVVVDGENHEILILAEGGNILRTIGGIGNRPGDLYYPSETAMQDDRGRLVVDDSGNDRIQIFSQGGEYAWSFDVEKIKGVAISGDRIFYGSPEDGRLVWRTNFRSRSREAFGTLVDPQEIFGDLPLPGAEAQLSRALNRIHLTVDDEDHLWVAFQHLPRVRSYSDTGTLLLEERLNLAPLEDLYQSVLQPSQHRLGAPSINMDGVQLTIVIRDFSFCSPSQTFLLVSGNNDLIQLDTKSRISGYWKAPDGLGQVIAVACEPRSGNVFLSTQNRIFMVESPGLLLRPFEPGD